MKNRLDPLVPALTGFFLVALGGAPDDARGADPFLDAIQQEVGSVELDTGNQKSITGRAPSAPAKWRATPIAKSARIESDMPTDMSRQDFENYLQQHYFGSYAFYRKLTNGKRERIYRAYRKHPNIELVRGKIKQIYLK